MGSMDNRPPRQLSDADLVEAIIAGDREAFRHLVERHGAAVNAYLLAKMRDRSAAEDLAQDVFLAAYQQLASLQRREALQGWLIGVARNKLREHWRRNGRGPGRVDRPIDEVAERLAEPGFAPSAAAAAAEVSVAVTAAIAELKERYRAVVWMRLIDERPFSEIAAQLRIREGTARMRFQRGSAALRKLLKRRGITLEEVRER